MIASLFFENIGGFLLTPKKHTLYILEGNNHSRRVKLRHSITFSFCNALFAGVFLMFFMMYPEVFLVPGASDTGRLFIYAAADPIFILAMLGLGFFLVIVFDILLQGSFSYFTIRRTLKVNNNRSNLSYGRYISFYSFNHLPMTIFYIFSTFWIYFFEKFSYSKIFFPVTDITFPVVLHFGILGFLLIWKWIGEIQIKIAIFEWAKIPKLQKRESIIISICIKLWLVTVLFFILYFSSNLIAGAQWS